MSNSDYEEFIKLANKLLQHKVKDNSVGKVDSAIIVAIMKSYLKVAIFNIRQINLERRIEIMDIMHEDDLLLHQIVQDIEACEAQLLRLHFKSEMNQQFQNIYSKSQLRLPQLRQKFLNTIQLLVDSNRIINVNLGNEILGIQNIL